MELKEKYREILNMEKVIDRIYIAGGIIILIVVILAMSGCASSNKCSNNKFVKEYNNW